jgi:hypothetical protein
LLDQPRPHRPVRPPIDPHTDPAALPDVGRPEEALGIREDHRLLLTERRGQPYGEVLGAVMVIVELGEQPSAYAPRGLAPRHLLDGLGQRQADRA